MPKKEYKQTEKHKRGNIKSTKIFTKEQELQICNEYFSLGNPSCNTLAKKWNCSNETIRGILIENGFILRTKGETLKGKTYRRKVNNVPKCSVCGKNISKDAKKCHTCEHKGENNPRYKKERHIPNYCISCGKQIGRFAKRCYSCANKGERNPRYNHPHSEEEKQNLREKTLKYIQTHSGPFKDTKPELKMKDILNGLDIRFEHQFNLESHIFDFHILGTNIFIEVDGDYFHGNPKKYKNLNRFQEKVKERDLKKEFFVKNNNFILLRFWESDILDNTEFVINKIILAMEEFERAYSFNVIG